MGNSPASIRENVADAPLVVIIGAGYGGAQVAKALDSKLNVIMIDQKNYFLHNIGSLRGAVQEDFAKNCIIPYDNVLQYGGFIQGEVTNITNDGIKLDGRNDLLRYDYCVIATGTHYAFPMKSQINNAQNIQKSYDESSNIISKSNNIVIIGGGPVGIELLGEIGFKYPDKKITLIQSNEKILPGEISDGLRNSILTRIKDHFKNSTLILGERVNITDEMKNELKENINYLVGEREITTSKDNKIKTDLVFFATGARINSTAYEESIIKDAINPDNKRIKCKSTLQVEGFDNIFALGDCADLGALLAYHAGNQAEIVANNIIQLVAKKPNNLKNNPATSPVMFVPLGPNQGAAQLPIGGKIVGATIESKLKGSDLTWPKFWGILGHKEGPGKEIISQTIKEINYNLTDEDIERLSKVTKIDSKELRILFTGSESDDQKNDTNNNNNDDDQKTTGNANNNDNNNDNKEDIKENNKDDNENKNENTNDVVEEEQNNQDNNNDKPETEVEVPKQEPKPEPEPEPEPNDVKDDGANQQEDPEPEPEPEPKPNGVKDDGANQQQEPEPEPEPEPNEAEDGGNEEPNEENGGGDDNNGQNGVEDDGANQVNEENVGAEDNENEEA